MLVTSQIFVIPLQALCPRGGMAVESTLGILTHNGVCVISKASLMSAERGWGDLWLSRLNGLCMTPTKLTLNRGFLWLVPGRKVWDRADLERASRPLVPLVVPLQCSFWLSLSLSLPHSLFSIPAQGVPSVACRRCQQLICPGAFSSICQ